MQGHAELSVINPLVVVVDDDQAVRNSLKFSLETEGFAVRAYAGGRDLLMDWIGFPRDGCLIIDQNMPGMSGLELIARLRERDVAVRAILMTSHPTATVRKGAAAAGVRILEKPFLGNALVEVIRDVCCHPAPAAGSAH